MVSVFDIVLLENEASHESVGPDDIQARIELVKQLRQLPDDAFIRMQYLQPQVGCFNRCAFCSQSAGTDIWQLTDRGLRNLFSSIKTVAHEVATKRNHHSGPLVGYGRLVHRPGVIFPYMDNDIASYPHLYGYLQYASSDLQATVRVSTVGYSRRNVRLQSMHEAINRDLKHALAGIRFSFTPYTHGWTTAADRSERFSRDDFIRDFINTLKTYRPIVEHLGPGKETACVELRFRPLVLTQDADLDDTTVDGHHCVHIGPHLLISRDEFAAIPVTRISEVVNGAPRFDQPPTPYYLVTSDRVVANSDWLRIASEMIRSHSLAPTAQENVAGDISVRLVGMHKFANVEGIYYAADPDFDATGMFRAKHFYPRTDRRPVSGYLDSERYFLNALLAYKYRHGVGRRDEFESATWSDAEEVLRLLEDRAAALDTIDLSAGKHLRTEIIPMLLAYKRALAGAGYPAPYFFSRRFTVDTGQIVNQGRAIRQFSGLTATEDLPLTPREERGYGNVSVSALRGTVWRWSPNPLAATRHAVTRAAAGKKNVVEEQPGMTIAELDTRNLSPVTVEGASLTTHLVLGLELERAALTESAQNFALPGVTALVD